MPVHLVVTPPGAGPASAATSQVMAFAAHAASAPLVLLDVRVGPVVPASLAPRLIPPVSVLAELAPAILGELGASALAIARVPTASLARLAPLLPEVDTLTICVTRLGHDLSDAGRLCDAVAGSGIRGRSGQALAPWLLPVGWACQRNPGIRMHGWRRKLAEVDGNGRLHCLPLIQPWESPANLQMANRARIAEIGAILLRHLGAIAAGRMPERPADGMAGGDPWPNRPNRVILPPLGRVPGARLHLVHAVPR